MNSLSLKYARQDAIVSELRSIGYEVPIARLIASRNLHMSPIEVDEAVEQLESAGRVIVTGTGYQRSVALPHVPLSQRLPRPVRAALVRLHLLRA